MGGLVDLEKRDVPVVVESVRFALTKESSNKASLVHIWLASNEWFHNNYRLYNPNAFCKGFCGMAKTWFGNEDGSRVTDMSFPCRGRDCWLTKMGPVKQMDKTTCWRFHFRCHLQEAKDTKGFMLQVVEDGKLGDGQAIEAEIAKEVGVQVLRLDVETIWDFLASRDIQRLEELVRKLGGRPASVP